jgi:hypothetical protein
MAVLQGQIAKEGFGRNIQKALNIFSLSQIGILMGVRLALFVIKE